MLCIYYISIIICKENVKYRLEDIEYNCILFINIIKMFLKVKLLFKILFIIKNRIQFYCLYFFLNCIIKIYFFVLILRVFFYDL